MKSKHDFIGEARAAQRRLDRAVRQGARKCDIRSLARESVDADSDLINADDIIAENRWRQLREYIDSADCKRRIHINDSNRFDEDTSSVLFAFGAYGSTFILAFGSIDDALEDAADTLKDVAPGAFCDDSVTEAYNEARAVAVLIQRMAGDWEDDLPEGIEDDCREYAEVDCTLTEAGYLLSYEWHIVGENMTREEIIAFARGE